MQCDPFADSYQRMKATAIVSEYEVARVRAGHRDFVYADVRSLRLNDLHAGDVVRLQGRDTGAHVEVEIKSIVDHETSPNVVLIVERVHAG